MASSILKRVGFIGLSMAAAILMVDSFTYAQPPGRGGRGFGFGGMGGGRMMNEAILLRMEEVQEDLGISEEQLSQLTTQQNDIREEMRDKFSEMREEFEQLREKRRQAREAGEEGRPERMEQPEGRRRGDREQEEGKELDENDPRAKFRKVMEDVRTKAEEGVNSTLSTSQLERLEEIKIQATMQTTGPVAFLRGEIAEEIGVNDRQREKMQGYYSEAMMEMRGMRGAPREEFEEFRAEVNKQMLRMFNAKQRKALTKMQGKPIELDFTQFQRRRGNQEEKEGEEQQERRGRRGERERSDA